MQLASLLRPHLRQDNPKSYRETLIWAASGLGVGFAVGMLMHMWYDEDSPQPKVQGGGGLEGVTPPMFDEVEPVEGWVSRWTSRRAHAARRCQLDASVTTLPQMVQCALRVAFPESGSWNAVPEIAWMRDAQRQVDTDLRAEIAAMYPGGTSGWKTVLWLQGPRVLADCKDDLSPAKTAQCIAQTLYPAVHWPPVAGTDPWQEAFYHAVLDLVSADLQAPKPLGAV